MTVDRAGSFGCTRGLATDLAPVAFFGLAGADLLEEAATKLGPSPVVLLFFSTTNELKNTSRVPRQLTHSEMVFQEQG